MELLGDQELGITRVSTVDQVAEHLRTMIADGRLKQGQRLPEIPLAERFGVSRGTLRDAIRVLATEGLITHQIHRGALVTALARTDIDDIYIVRRLLEAEALRAFPRSPPATRERLESALSACEAAAAGSDYTGFIEHELEFHTALVALLGSSRLDRFFEQLLAELRLAYGLLSEDAETTDLSEIVARYRGIFEAAKAGRVAEARKLLAQHLNIYERRLTELVDAGEPEG